MSEQDNLRTDRSRVRRVANRGHYDRPTVEAILDAHFMCHIAFVDGGVPHIIPTLYARDGDRVLVHGSVKSRMIQVLEQGVPCSLSVTLVDGLVLARSAFHSSANYRSVVLYGTAMPVEGPEKLAALRTLTEHFVPGRWAEIRQPGAKEMDVTRVLALPIAEGAAKIRVGPPADDAEDYALDIWAGVIPLETKAGPAIPDPKLREGIGVPESVRNFKRK